MVKSAQKCSQKWCQKSSQKSSWTGGSLSPTTLGDARIYIRVQLSTAAEWGAEIGARMRSKVLILTALRFEYPRGFNAF